MLRICRTTLHAGVAALLMMSASTLGGCAGSGGASASFAMATSSTSASAPATASDGTTIAFDQIDGPPPQVFDRMVDVLDSESKLRSLAIVSREGPAAYRVRSYLSAQVVSGKTVIAWVWDVYDNNQQRALRLSGEEPIGRGAGRDPWAAADDLVLRKIAQAGLSGLSGMLNGTAPSNSAPPQLGPAPASRGPAIASTDPSPPFMAAESASYSATALGYTDN